MTLAFASPLLLWALVGLPALWLLLRAVPPAPIRRRFPGVALLLGLTDQDRQAERTPWWLLVLRMAAAALLIIGFAGPVLNAAPGAGSNKPLLVLVDGGWPDAADWSARQAQAADVIARAGRDGRPLALLRLTDGAQEVEFQAADAVAPRVQGLAPQPWLADDLARLKDLPEGDFDTYWLSDGVARPGREALRAALAERGEVVVFQTGRPLAALRAPRFEEGAVMLPVLRLDAASAVRVEVRALGPDPSGQERELARGVADFAAGQAETEIALPLPPELRNRITRFEIDGARHAGAVVLTDDSLKRRKVALVAGGADREELQLLSQTHYLRQALEPMAELIEGGVADVLPAAPDVIVLADVARLTGAEAEGVQEWLAKGGLLLRFAGPRLAASDVSRAEEDPLMPVRLREGGRTVGGAMSWG